MTNQYYNFYYDPTSNGYDPLSWRSLYGTPSIVGTRLSVSSSTIIHLAQMLRGDFVFNLLLPSPTVGDDRQIGLVQYNQNAYAYFKIQNDVLTAETSDGVTEYSTPIEWQAEWSGVNTSFRIKWESGSVRFYVNDTLQATITYSTLLDVPVSAIPNNPLSIYLSDYGSADPLLLNFIEAKGIQSYILLTSNSSVVVGHQVEELDRLTITESVEAVATMGDISTVDSITLTDVPTVEEPS